jgi:phage terminase Nu1 subunit (DNA packaging protein)
MVSARQLAAAFGVTVRTATDYIRRGCPTTSIRAARDWRRKNIASNGPPSIGERATGVKPKVDKATKDELLRAKIRKHTCEADAWEMKNAATRAELYDAKAVHAAVAELLDLVRERLASVPDELAAATCAGLAAELYSKVRGRIADKARLLQTEIDQWRPEYADVPPVDEVPADEEIESEAV